MKRKYNGRLKKTGKRFFIFQVFLFFITTFLICPTGTHATAAKDFPVDLRVGISLAGNNLEFSIEKEYTLESLGNGDPLLLPAGRYCLASMGDGRVELSALQSGLCVSFQGPLLLQPPEPPFENQFFRLHNALYGQEYRGALEIIPENNVLTAINILDLESYLRGVLPGEMPPAWGGYGGMEALKAQAVAARTYALYNRLAGRHSSYHLCDEQHCQVYKGKAYESHYTDRAVKETGGEILTFGGQVVEPFYHASNGGFTELSQNVWPEKRLYLASVPDPYDDPSNPLGLSDFICCPQWTVDFTLNSLGDLLASKACNIGAVNHIEIISSFPSGRVEEIIVQGRGGRSVSLLKEQARIMLGLESQLYSVYGKPVSRLWFISADQNQQKKESFLELAEKWVLDGHNNRSKLLGDRFFALGDGVQDYIPCTYIPCTGFVFRGQGRGHGVGLSQYGAYNRSRAGQGYIEILSFYYPGTEVVGR